MKHLTLALIAGAVFTTIAGADPAEKTRRDPKQMFSRLDTNADSKIELSEFLARKSKNEERRTAIFKKLDTNADGYITAEEFQSHADKRSKRLSRPSSPA